MALLRPLKIILRTPIEKLKGLKINTQIFIKRDDLNGLLISGNKARKLEYLIADAKNRKCNTIITCGPVQSNHCRTTAVFAKRFGLECHLLLRAHRKPNKVYTANLLINKLINAKIKYITPAQYKQRMTVMAKYAQALKKKGKKPYIIPEGGSNEIGSLGYLECMREMQDFIKQQKIEAVYCAVGSGGTYAGLLLGKKLLKLKIDLNGVIVCDSVEYFRTRILDICDKTIQRFNVPVRISNADIDLIDGYIGEGYGISYPEELRTIRRIANCGIILEPVYTGKTFYGMLEHIKKKKYKKVIFIHTGGIFSIFAHNKELSAVIG